MLRCIDMGRWALKNNTATKRRMKKDQGLQESFIEMCPSLEDPLNDPELGRDIRSEIGYNYLEWRNDVYR